MEEDGSQRRMIVQPLALRSRRVVGFPACAYIGLAGGCWPRHGSFAPIVAIVIVKGARGLDDHGRAWACVQ